VVFIDAIFVKIRDGQVTNRRSTGAARAIPEFVMNQLESTDNLADLIDPRIRLLVEILIPHRAARRRHPTSAAKVFHM
jgi:hypothetical protein